ncbi:hypothetical protein [Hymenobacter sp. UYP22]|uniref:hypothetical protein n=1 Tax=Hymenobacter sp. UYP22 TaxID=3156348 RepID=UPI0033978FB7
MKVLLSLGSLGLWLCPQVAWACRVCRPRVQATIHGPDYGVNLAVLLLPLGLLLLLGVGVFFAPSIQRRFTRLFPAHG